MRLMLDQRGGSLLFRANGQRFHVKGGGTLEVDEATGADILAQDLGFVVAPEVAEEPPAEAPEPDTPPEPEMTAEPEVAEVATSTTGAASTGAISTADLKAGGRRGGKRKRA